MSFHRRHAPVVLLTGLSSLMLVGILTIALMAYPHTWANAIQMAVADALLLVASMCLLLRCLPRARRRSAGVEAVVAPVPFESATARVPSPNPRRRTSPQRWL